MGLDWANVTVGAGVLLCGLALLLAVVAGIAAGRLRNGKLALVALAFGGFLAVGLLLTKLAYDARLELAAGSAGELPTLILAELGIVVTLYLAVLKR